MDFDAPEFDPDPDYEPNPAHARRFRIALPYLSNALRDPEWGETLCQRFWPRFCRALEAVGIAPPERKTRRADMNPSDAPAPRRKRGGRSSSRLNKAEHTREAHADLVAMQKAFQRALAKSSMKVGPFQDNIDALSKHLGLSKAEKQVLEIYFACCESNDMDNFADAVLSHTHSVSRTLSILMGLDAAEAHRLIVPRGTLISSGLIRLDLTGDNFCRGDAALRVSTMVEKALRRPYQTADEMTVDILGPPRTTALSLESDFPHMARDSDFLSRLLQGAVTTRAEAVNILFHGAPGTGKTEFATALAGSLGMKLQPAGEADDDGDEPSRTDRISHFKLLQRLVGQTGASLILVDEAEDILADSMDFLMFGGRSSRSKIFNNRILEETRVPTIWIVNDLRKLPAPVIRRFLHVIRFSEPPASVKASMWRRQAANSGLKMEEEAFRDLAGQKGVGPALIAHVVRGAALAGSDRAELHRLTRSLATANGARAGDGATAGAEIDPNLLIADTDLKALGTRLADSGERTVSLLLSGPPGSGKSAWVRHLADTMGLEVIQKRTSDLMSPYVGETERNIAEAFRAAESAGAFLVFDEADSLIGDRRKAVRNWEVSLVNEMLSQMEQHPYPFACTTNLEDALDPATLRRFTFKIRLKALDPRRAALAFSHYFGGPCPETVQYLAPLTLGDFATVARRRRILGIDDPWSIADMLADEVRAKDGAPKHPVGFTAGSVRRGEPAPERVVRLA